MEEFDKVVARLATELLSQQLHGPPTPSGLSQLDAADWSSIGHAETNWEDRRIDVEETLRSQCTQLLYAERKAFQGRLERRHEKSRASDEQRFSRLVNKILVMKDREVKLRLKADRMRIAHRLLSRAESARIHACLQMTFLLWSSTCQLAAPNRSLPPGVPDGLTSARALKFACRRQADIENEPPGNSVLGPMPADGSAQADKVPRLSLVRMMQPPPLNAVSTAPALSNQTASGASASFLATAAFQSPAARHRTPIMIRPLGTSPLQGMTPSPSTTTRSVTPPRFPRGGDGYDNRTVVQVVCNQQSMSPPFSQRMVPAVGVGMADGRDPSPMQSRPASRERWLHPGHHVLPSASREVSPLTRYRLAHLDATHRPASSSRDPSPLTGHGSMSPPAPLAPQAALVVQRASPSRETSPFSGHGHTSPPLPAPPWATVAAGSQHFAVAVEVEVAVAAAPQLLSPPSLAPDPRTRRHSQPHSLTSYSSTYGQQSSAHSSTTSFPSTVTTQATPQTGGSTSSTHETPSAPLGSFDFVAASRVPVRMVSAGAEFPMRAPSAVADMPVRLTSAGSVAASTGCMTPPMPSWPYGKQSFQQPPQQGPPQRLPARSSPRSSPMNSRPAASAATWRNNAFQVMPGHGPGGFGGSGQYAPAGSSGAATLGSVTPGYGGHPGLAANAACSRESSLGATGRSAQLPLGSMVNMPRPLRTPSAAPPYALIRR